MKTFTGKFTRFFSLALAIIMVFSFSFVAVSAEDAAVDASGTFDAIDWVYTAADKTITVTPIKGGNYNVQYNTAALWVDLDYEKIVVEEGIVELISHAFVGSKAKTIILPNSLRKIREGAFKNSTNLKWLHIPVGVTTLGKSIVQGCSSLESIYLPQTLVAADVDTSWCYDNDSDSTINISKLYMFPAIDNVDANGQQTYAALRTKTYNKFYNKATITKVNAVNMKADGTVEYTNGIDNFKTLLTNASVGDTVVALNSMTVTGLPEYAEGVKVITNALVGKSGTAGDVKWVYTAVNKTITITGTGTNGAGTVPQGISLTGNWSELDYNKIVVSEGITELATRSLQTCKMLYLTLPSTLVKVGDLSFNACGQLKQLHIPVGVTTIGGNIIQNCTALQTVYLPLTLTSVSNSWCVDGSNGNKSGIRLYMDSKVNSTAYATLKEKTYDRYYSYFSSANTANFKADGSIVYGAFDTVLAAATAGDTVVVLTDVTSTGSTQYAEGVNVVYNAFVGKSGTAGDVKWVYSAADKTITVTGTGENGAGTVPATISATGSWPDLNYNKVIVSEGITELAATSFQSAKMEYITLPSTLVKIGEKAFNYCTKLKALHIPVGVTTIGSMIVRYCDKLEVIYFPNTITSFNTSWYYEMVRTQGEDTVRTIYYSSSTLNNTEINYKGQLTTWGVTKKVVDTMKTSADGTVTYGKFNDVVTSAVKGDKVDVLSSAESTGIPAYADGVKLNVNGQFVGKSGTAGDVKWVYYAFDKEIVVKGTGENGAGIVPATISSTGSWSSLDYNSVVVNEGITELAATAFQSASKMEHISLPSTLVVIGDKAFNSCTKLQELHVPYGVTTLGNCMIQQCNSLKFVYLPSSLVAANVNTTWYYDGYTDDKKVALEKLYMFPEITYSQNAALKQKTYDKYFSDGVVVLVDGAFEVDGEKTYGTLKTVLADATKGAQIKFASYIKADVFVTQDVTFVPNNFGYGNIFVADTNGDADIDILDFIKLTNKIADDEGTVEINTAGLEFKASYAAKNMTKLKKYLLGLAV